MFLPVIIGKTEASSDRVPIGDNPWHDLELFLRRIWNTRQRRQIEKLFADGQSSKRFGNASDGVKADQLSGSECRVEAIGSGGLGKKDRNVGPTDFFEAKQDACNTIMLSKLTIPTKRKLKFWNKWKYKFQIR